MFSFTERFLEQPEYTMLPQSMEAHMITHNLWRAEWLKTRKRPVNIGMLVLMLVLLTAIFVITTGLALYDPATHLPEARSMLAWPNSLDMALDMAFDLGALLAVIATVNSRSSTGRALST